jgi:hypothetical protein
MHLQPPPSMLCAVHINSQWPDHHSNIQERAQIMKLLLSSCSHTHVTSPSDPNTFSNTLLSYSLNVCSFETQVSHTHKTREESMVSYILIVKFKDRRWDHKRDWTEWQQTGDVTINMVSNTQKYSWQQVPALSQRPVTVFRANTKPQVFTMVCIESMLCCLKGTIQRAKPSSWLQVKR